MRETGRPRIAALLNRPEPYATRPDETFDDGLNVTELLMTAYMSAELGTAIDFPPSDLATFVPAVARGEWNPKS